MLIGLTKADLLDDLFEVKFEGFSFNSDSISSGSWVSRLRIEGEEVRLMYADDVPAYYYKISELDSLK